MGIYLHTVALLVSDVKDNPKVASQFVSGSSLLWLVLLAATGKWHTVNKKQSTF